MTRFAEWKHIADRVTSTTGQRFDVMQLQLSSTMAAGAAMFVSAQLCLPLCARKIAAVSHAGATVCRIVLLICAAVRCAFPVATNFASAPWIVLRPFMRTADDYFSMSLVPSGLVRLRLQFVLSVIAALIDAVLLAMFLPPLAAVSASLALVFRVVLAPLALIFGGVFPILLLFRHVRKCTTTTRIGACGI